MLDESLLEKAYENTLQSPFRPQNDASARKLQFLSLDVFYIVQTSVLSDLLCVSVDDLKKFLPFRQANLLNPHPRMKNQPRSIYR